MIERYSRQALRDIWSIQNQYQTWLDVEIAVDAGWVAAGHIPAEDLEKSAKTPLLTLTALQRLSYQRAMMLWHLRVTCQNHLAKNVSGFTMA